MQIGNLVGFKKELFFEGAVQLRWYQDNPGRAKTAAENFVFHGPRYHGVSEAEDRGLSRAYKLKDTATFIHDLLCSLKPSTGMVDVNPLLLAVAGYGSGKSHFALTAAQLLSHPNSAEALAIIKNIYSADSEIGTKVSGLLEELARPALIVTLDGMSNFHLGSELSRGIIRQLKNVDADLTPITELSPRFKLAENFVVRNYEFRKEEFSKAGLRENLEEIVEKLQEQDEDIYSAVDDVYSDANGTRIPVDGHESAQDLIKTVCDVYCGDGGQFSGLFIFFDEFGRYFEYAAEKPNLAGDSALQQIFQGIQDSSEKARFVGFIQYELKAYLNRFNQRDLLQLQRYITRFDSSEKLYLSSNLETLFAHLIEKRNKEELSQLLESSAPKGGWAEVHGLLAACLPGFKRVPVWADFDKFKQVIVEGGWPLHPMTTWFLTRHQDIVQSRSALTFIKDAIDSVASKPCLSGKELYFVSPAELVLQSMLPEIIAAERVQGGAIAETLQALLEKYKTRITEEQRLLLAGVMILDKLRAETREKLFVDKLLGFVSGLSDDSVQDGLSALSSDIGAVEWNADFGQYELIADAATRGQFQQLLNKKIQEIDKSKIGEIFIHRGGNYADLTDIVPDFNQKYNISTSDWFFKTSLANSKNFREVLKDGIDNWESAFSHDDPKGQLAYILIQEGEDFDAIVRQINETYEQYLGDRVAPIWTVAIHDRDGKICECLAKTHILEESFNSDEQEKFRRFIPEERARSLRALVDAVNKAQRERYFYVAGLADVPGMRLKPFATWVFEQVYHEVIPFHFDGFSAKTGSGPRDCMDLIRALVSRQVNGDWIALQKKAMQNRVTQLLVKDWKVIGSDGRLSREPGLKPLAKLLCLIEEKHEEENNRTLGTTFKELLRPPYGFNASSAGVVLGLLLAKDLPPRALKLSGESCSLEEWMVKVLPNARGKYSFDIKGLDKTNLLFLEEDAEQRWNTRIQNIESETRYAQIVLLFKEAEKQKSADPLPQNLIGHYSYIRDKANEAERKIGEFYNEVDEIENGLEKAERQRNVKSIIYFGGKLGKKNKQMESEKELWEEMQIQELANLLNSSRDLLSGRLDEWIAEQSCNNIKQVSDFRFKIEKTIRRLEDMGLGAEAEKLDVQKNKIITQVDLRAEYETSLKKAADIVRLPNPTTRDKVLSLRQSMEEIDTLVVILGKLNKSVDANDVNSLISRLKSRRKLYEEIEEKHKECLAKIYDSHVDGIEAVSDSMQLVKELQTIFSGTRDESDVVDIFNQLKIFQQDMLRWNALDLPCEELEKLLQEQVPKRAAEVEAQIDEAGGEPFCDIESVYLGFTSKVLASRKQKSSLWLKDILPNLKEVRSWSVDECERQIDKLKVVPPWVSLGDRDEVARCVAMVKERKQEHREEERRRKASDWLNRIRAEADSAKGKGIVHCEKLVAELSLVPDYIDKEDFDEIVSMRKQIQSHIDEMNIDDLFQRICGLSEHLRESLISRVEDEFL